MNYTSATSLNTAAALVLQAVLQLQCARVDPVGLPDDPVGLPDAAPAAARKVMTAGLSVIAGRIPLGTFSRWHAP